MFKITANASSGPPGRIELDAQRLGIEDGGEAWDHTGQALTPFFAFIVVSPISEYYCLKRKAFRGIFIPHMM